MCNNTRPIEKQRNCKLFPFKKRINKINKPKKLIAICK